MGKDLKNEIGNTYGKLEVISRGENLIYGNGRQKAQWNCLCKCGKTKLIVGTQLRRGMHQSCGCGRGWHTYKGYEDISSTYFSALKYGAKSRNIKFDITIVYIWDLFIKQNKKCALTGLDININKHLSIERFKNQTASLDRIDSNKGYIEGNVWWVHKEVNNLKSDLQLDRFIELCDLISKNKDKCYEQLNSRNLQSRECSASQ